MVSSRFSNTTSMIEAVKNDKVKDMDLSMFSKDSVRTALIDTDSMLYYCLKPDMTFDDVTASFDDFMFSIMRNTGASCYLGFFSESPVFRHAIGVSKPYKGNRNGRDTPLLFYSLKKYAYRAWGIHFVSGLEADDCVSLYRTADTVICSPDKDVLRQLPGTHYNYQRNEYVHTSEKEAFEFLWSQVVAGDSVDGIPGIPGIGVKKAELAVASVVTEQLPLKILQMYMQHFASTGNAKEAYDRFKEALDLVYVLRTKYDTDRLGIELPDLKPVNILTALDLWKKSPGT